MILAHAEVERSIRSATEQRLRGREQGVGCGFGRALFLLGIGEGAPRAVTVEYRIRWRQQPGEILRCAQNDNVTLLVSQCNFGGAEMNPAKVRFGNAHLSRD